ncbi:MAG: hypothetical protein ACTHK0_13305 [Ginsengibacter sp.]
MNPENLELIDAQLSKIGLTEKERKQIIDKLILDVSQNQQQNETLSARFLMYRKNHETTANIPVLIQLDFINHNQHYELHSFKASSEQKEIQVPIRNTNLTVDQAFNLLQGRSVHLPGVGLNGTEGKGAWLQLDLSKANDSGSYKLNSYSGLEPVSLKNELQKLEIKDFNNNTVSIKIIESSIQQGNLVKVTLEKNGHQPTVLIEAAPKENSLRIYSDQGYRLSLTPDSLALKLEVNPNWRKPKDLIRMVNDGIEINKPQLSSETIRGLHSELKSRLEEKGTLTPAENKLKEMLSPVLKFMNENSGESSKQYEQKAVGMKM